MPSTRAGRVARQCAAARRAAVVEQTTAELWVRVEHQFSELVHPAPVHLVPVHLDRQRSDSVLSTELHSAGLHLSDPHPAQSHSAEPHPASTRRDLRVAARATGGHHAVLGHRLNRPSSWPTVPHLGRHGLPWRGRALHRPDVPEWLTLGRAVAAVLATVVLAVGGTAAARAGALSSPPLTVPERAEAAGFSDGSSLPAATDVDLTAATAAPLDGSGGAPAAVSPAAQRPAESWVTSVAVATGVSPVAIRAYGTAALAAASSTPTCGVGWATVAAIGQIESGHGTFGGATLLDDGHTSVPILGPALNGTGGTAAIPSTPESVRWHSDPEWEHAVGPMQVLPSTWERWATDGDGDGTSDPTDLDDAAAMAARYLCADGATMTTPSGWHDAVFSYNHAESYVAQVAEVAAGYVKATAP